MLPDDASDGTVIFEARGSAGISFDDQFIQVQFSLATGKRDIPAIRVVTTKDRVIP
jgi:hypothetical protein